MRNSKKVKNFECQGSYKQNIFIGYGSQSAEECQGEREREGEKVYNNPNETQIFSLEITLKKKKSCNQTLRDVFVVKKAVITRERGGKERERERGRGRESINEKTRLKMTIEKST